MTRNLEEQGDIKAVISRLRLNDDKSGKLAFAESLRLLDRSYIRYIQTLSEARNDFVHDVECLKITLYDYLKGLRPERQAKFLNAIVGLLEPEAKIGDVFVKPCDIVKQIPKPCVYLGAIDLLAHIYIENEKIKIREERRRYAHLALDLWSLANSHLSAVKEAGGN